MSSQKPKILVIGSSNTDMVVKSSHLPSPGETVIGGDFVMNPGGKGANQAVAAAKLGGLVTFVARVGDDLFGNDSLRGFGKLGIDTSFIVKDTDHPSGVALIMVDDQGENTISVALGSNGFLDAVDIKNAEEAFLGSSFMLIQLETPMSTVEFAVSEAKSAHLPVILNPAPAQPLSDELLESLAFITPNESEAEILTGITVVDAETAKKAAGILRDKGVGAVVITLGSKGAYLLSRDFDELIPAPVVEALDTTAAGDTFNGALAVALGEGKALSEAVAFANRAAALSVTRYGAQSSVPMRNEII